MTSAALFLREHVRAFLVTRRADGAPTVHPMGLIYRDGSVYFNTYRRSAKVRNLERDPRVSCLVASADDDPEFAALNLRGRAEVVPATDVPDSLLTGLGSGGPAAISDRDLRRVRDRVTSGKRVYVRVAVDEAGFCEPLAPALRRRSGEGHAGASWEMGVVPAAISMSPDEVAAFLASKDVAALGTVDRDGHPRAIAVRSLPGRGAVHLAVPLVSSALEDLAAEPRACATVEEFPTYDAIRGVMVHGPSRATTDEEWAAAVDHAVPAGHAAITVDAQRVISFDFRKIGTR